MMLVIIDTHSKWIEAVHTANATSTTVIEELRERFAQFGIPQTIVTDNGTCFTSADFESFLSDNGIHHLTSAPYHPASNGLAERAVQIVKKGLKKNKKGTFRIRLSRTLFSYWITPQATSVSPAELLDNLDRNCIQISQRGWRGNSSHRKNNMIVVLRRESSVLVQKCGYGTCKEVTSGYLELF